jgi:drug/metabolite transporter (DMT)-like permease
VSPSPPGVERKSSGRGSPPPRATPAAASFSSALLLVAAALVFAVMAAIAKRAATRIPGPEVALVRFIVGLIACAAAATRVRMRANNWVGLAMRGAFGGAAVLCYFLTIEHLPVGVATLLNYTAPVFTALWAALFLGERVGPRVLAALALTVGGVGLVITGSAPPGSLGLGPWQLVGMTAAVLSGAAIATIREVRKTDGSWEIFVSFCFVGALITAVPAARRWVTPTSREWALMVGVGSLSVVAQLLMTYALRYVRATMAGIIGQLTPVAALALGWLCYGDRIPPLALAGAAVTLVGVSWGAWQEAASAAGD